MGRERRPGRPVWQHLAVLTVVPLVATGIIATGAVLARSSEVSGVLAAQQHLTATQQLDAVRRAVDREALPALALAVARGTADTTPASLPALRRARVLHIGPDAVAESRAATDAALDAVDEEEVVPALGHLRRHLALARHTADTGATGAAGVSMHYTRISDALLTAEHRATAQASSASTRAATGAALDDVEAAVDLTAEASRQLALAFTASTVVPAERGPAVRQLQEAVGTYGRAARSHGELSDAALRDLWVDAVTDIRSQQLAVVLAEAGTADAPDPLRAEALLDLRLESAERDKAHERVLRLALEDARLACQQDAADAERALVATASTAALAVVLSTLVTGVVARQLTRSLRDLGTAAVRALEGEAVTPQARGPREVRDAGEALERTAAGLRRVHEQAEAVARGDLRRAVELPALPGRLGSVLHASIEAVVLTVEARDALRAELVHRATHDALTGLPNRVAVVTALGAALTPTPQTDDDDPAGSDPGGSDPGGSDLGDDARGVAVLFVDLDGFKAVNDGHGHAAGDHVLRSVGERLRTAARHDDVAGRLGGDEFVLVLEDTTLPEAVLVAERVVSSVQQPVRQDGGGPELLVGASVGVALGAPGATTADELLAEADAAVYRAKRQGRGRVVVHDERLRREVAERAALAVELQSALAAGRLELLWEPVVGTDRDAVARWSAVPSWRRASGEVLSGPDLVRAAVDADAETDLSRQLDLWTLTTATLEARRAAHRVPVAVALGRRTLVGPALADVVVDALVASALPAELLTVVVAEEVVGAHPGAAHALAVLRAAGVRVAATGSGATPLRELAQLPVDEVWLDVPAAPAEGTPLRRSTDLLLVAVAALGLDVVVGPVRDPEDLHRAREVGATAVFGPLLGLPARAGDRAVATV